MNGRAWTAGAAPEIVVVRDRDPAALRHPEPRLFRGRGPVAYVHASEAGALPPAAHYVFNLERLDDTSLARARLAEDAGARVSVILKHLDESTAALLARTSWNVLPAYGDAEHIGTGTMRRALRAACDGVPVVARGFLSNSAEPDRLGAPRAAHGFVRLMQRMSEEAKHGEPVAAAVLAPHRTGSQWLRDLVGWTAAASVGVVHEHAVPPEDERSLPCRSLADALAREPDVARHRGMRRAAIRSVLMRARRRYIFVTLRDPIERAISLFIKRHSRILRERLDAGTQAFQNPAEVQRQFEQWLPAQVSSYSRWFRTTLFDHFGLDVCRAEPTDGMLVARHPPNVLVVVPTETLNLLRDGVDAAYGPDSCAVLADDSAIARGDGPVMAAFHREIGVPPALATALRDIRESAFVRASAHRVSLAG